MVTNFADVRRKAAEEWDALNDSDRPTVLVGTATCGRSAGSMDALEAFRAETDKRGIDCNVIEVGCIGMCFAEPIACITKPGKPAIAYGSVTADKAAQLVDSYLAGDDPLAEYSLGTLGDGRVPGIADLSNSSVFLPQVRRILRNCGSIDPTKINHYIANKGYSGLEKALSLEPQQVIDEIRESGLRGRGGAGYPTWQKWQYCREAEGDQKYLICNADEGDPGAFMNRSLLEGDPHSVLEGMVIAGYALGASQGYIYCRAEYPLALDRLETAIAQAEEYGLLGDDILGSGFNFHVKVKEGAGAFVCGEETALIASIEGERGMPRPRPPFPAVSGLWGKPTIINNVESLVSVALVLQNGAEWFAEVGTEKSKGTKTFALVGKIKNTGLVEVPMGITLRQIIYEIGGGVLNDRRFKAVQTGGPSGGCIPAELLDTPVDYDSLTAAGSIMGSGGMVAMDEDTCMVDVARYFLDFTRKESCGKCSPCRLGTKQMLDILTRITDGKGKPADIELLLEIGHSVKTASLCGLGQTAPNPVLTTIRYFRDEYESHINDKRCPAKVCRELITYNILEDKCTGCHLCAKACPVNAITGVPKEIHVINQSICIKCGVCFEKCPPKFSAIECVAGQSSDGGNH